MNLEEIFEGLDLESPLTDHELDYLDIIGKNPVDIIEIRNLAEEKNTWHTWYTWYRIG